MGAPLHPEKTLKLGRYIPFFQKHRIRISGGTHPPKFQNLGWNLGGTPPPQFRLLRPDVKAYEMGQNWSDFDENEAPGMFFQTQVSGTGPAAPGLLNYAVWDDFVFFFKKKKKTVPHSMILESWGRETSPRPMGLKNHPWSFILIEIQPILIHFIRF